MGEEVQTLQQFVVVVDPKFSELTTKSLLYIDNSTKFQGDLIAKQTEIIDTLKDNNATLHYQTNLLYFTVVILGVVLVTGIFFKVINRFL